MKVRTRIVVGLSLLIVLVFGALLIQSLFLSHLRDVSIDLKDSKIPTVRDMRDLKEQLQRLHRSSVLLSSSNWRDPAFRDSQAGQLGILLDARTQLTGKMLTLEQFVAEVDKVEKAHTCRLRASLDEVTIRLQPYERIAAEIEDRFPDRPLGSTLRNLANQLDQTDDAFREAIEDLGVAIDCVVESSVSESVDKADRAVALSTVLIIVALGASLWAGLWIVRSVTGPLAALTKAHRKWMLEDFSHQVPVESKSKDEFSELARSGNAMAQRLGQLDELKKDFLSHISHELKSPLNAIQSSAQMLLRETSGRLTPRQRRRVELMLENGERLSKNILNLLDYSRLEAGVFHYDFAVQDLIPVVHRFLESVEPAVLEKGLRLEKRIPVGQPVPLRCDSERLLQVVGNLVDNALKFSPPDSCLAVRLEVGDRLKADGRKPTDSAVPFALISVIDSGSGVPEDQQESIFTKFHQVTGSRKGVGLGLAICRKIVQAHQGRIWYEDNPEGGSIFRVLLPLATQGISRQDAKTQSSQRGD